MFTLWSLHGERERSEQSHQKRKLICFETNYKQWKLGNFAGGQWLDFAWYKCSYSCATDPKCSFYVNVRQKDMKWQATNSWRSNSIELCSGWTGSSRSLVRFESPSQNIVLSPNRPFPSSLVPLFQVESKCETILMKMTFICMKMKLHAELIFIWKVSHLDSLWNRGTRELENGLFNPFVINFHLFHVSRNSCITSDKIIASDKSFKIEIRRLFGKYSLGLKTKQLEISKLLFQSEVIH